MTKADIVNEIAKSTGVEKIQVQAIVEAFMENVKGAMIKGENVYLRGFGSFIAKQLPLDATPLGRSWALATETQNVFWNA